MKSQNRRLINQPIKSPSPDVAHRSIITNTKSPANQIREYIKVQQSSTSPKSMTTSFHQISKSYLSSEEENKTLKKCIQQLEGKLQYYEKIRVSHEQILIINQRLNAELAQLRQELNRLREKQKSISHGPHNPSPKNIKTLSPKSKGVSLVQQNLQNINHQMPVIQSQNDNVLRQFNERMIRMADENKRLLKKLGQIKRQKDGVQIQNSRLREQGRHNALKSPIEGIDSMEQQNLKRYFNEQADDIYKHYQRINEGKIVQINSRMSKVEDTFSRIAQKQHQVKVYHRTNSPHEIKANISIDTNIKSDYQDQQPATIAHTNRYDMVESKYTTSPSDVKAFTLDSSPIRAIEEEKVKIKNQNERILRRALEAEGKLKQALFANSELQTKIKLIQPQQRPKSPTLKQSLSVETYNMPSSSYPATSQTTENNQLIGLYKQKVDLLQNQLSKNVSQLRAKQKQLIESKRRMQQCNKISKEQSFNYEKVLAQERDKSKHFQVELYAINESSRKLQVKLQLSEEKIKQLEAESQGKENKRYIQLQYQLNQFKQSYHKLRDKFERYLQMALEVRYSITGDEVNQTLQQIESKYQGYDQLQIQILKINKFYEAIIDNLKKSLLERDQKVAQLERTNQILAETIRQINIEKRQIQSAILEYKRPVKVGEISVEEMQRKISMHQSSVSKTKQQCHIREYINRTVSKIDTLQKQIDLAIKSNRKPVKGPQVSQRPTQNNRIYYYDSRPYFNNNAAEVDTGHRTTIKQQSKQFYESEGNEHLQDPSLLYQENSESIEKYE